jgi:hypothetical protein
MPLGNVVDHEYKVERGWTPGGRGVEAVVPGAGQLRNRDRASTGRPAALGRDRCIDQMSHDVA